MVGPLDVPSPEQILGLDEERADALLDRLERTVPVHPSFVRISTVSLREAIVFGDVHGDWRSLNEVVRPYLASGAPRLLVGLGDYVDRAPPDCGAGSVATALHLLALAAAAPSRVVLIQGNHETTRRIPVLPRELPEEVDGLWGPDATRLTRIEALLERGPLAAVLPEGVYLAHAGFPMVGSAEEWARAFDDVNDDRLAEIVWSVCDSSRHPRAGVPTWGGTGPGAPVPGVRGSACSSGVTTPTSPVVPSTTGIASPCIRRGCSSDSAESITLRFPLGRPVESIRDTLIEHLATEGQTYAPVD